MNEITRKEVAEIVKEAIETGNKIEDLIVVKYGHLTTSQLFKVLDDVNKILSAAKKELGSVGLKKLYEYLTAERDTISVSTVNEDGTVDDLGTFEGSIKFDPNGEIPDVTNVNDFNSKTDIKFGDELNDFILYGKKSYNNSEDIKYGDEDDLRDNQNDQGSIPKPVFGDEDEFINNVMDSLKKPGEKPKDFEFGDESVNPYKKDDYNSFDDIPSDDNGFDGPKFGGF